SIKLNRSGSCTDADISMVSLYKDDLRIGTGSFVDGYTVFAGLNIELAPNTSNNIFVVYNISASATLGNAVGMTLFEPASIILSGAGSVSTVNLPITSNSSLISRFALAQELTGVSMSSAIWGDYDNDGNMDILIGGSSLSGNICKVFRNDSWIFSLAADLPGISHGESVYGSSWGDYDNDGDLDIAITGLGSSVIYRNTNGNFESINANLPGLHNSSINWGDYDNDGDIDLALAGNNLSSRITRIYQNNNGTFTNIEANLTGISQGALSWVDYNNDGWLDLSINGESDSEGEVAKTYKNKGNGSFEDSGIILPGIYVGCLAWADYDNDGDMDTAVTGGNNKISRIYRNDNGTFTNIGAGLQGVWISSAAWGDYDNDGFMDLALIGKSDGMGDICNIYKNNGNGSFTMDTAINLTGVCNGAINWGDYDHDGDIDILLAGGSSEGGITRIYGN
ncbi:MAG: VCBS repeat-containing protein, partial [Candidatus Desantisbacteria bacterium]